MTPPADVPDLVRDLPVGTYRGTANSKQYLATKSVFSGGRAIKLVARELGDADYVSLNLYDLARGPQLFPCEMPAEKVIAFLRNFLPSEALKELRSTE